MKITTSYCNVQRLVHTRGRCFKCSCRSNTRESKNPRDFKDMDAMRAYLNRQTQGVSFSGMLNWLSEHAFGDVQNKGRWSLALGYRWLVSTVTTAFPQANSLGPSNEELLRALGVERDYVSQMARLIVCSEDQAIRVIRRYPQVVQMDQQVLSHRLIGLKMAVPECDIGLLVELQPRLFLEGDQTTKEQVIRDANANLRKGLPGANVTAMIELDPGILFEDVSSGIEGLLELWPVTADTFANSDPQHLALAVRALSVKGAPKRI